MRSIMANPPESISALADRLDRNDVDVHADVDLFADHRIAYFDADGRAKRPVIPYGTIEFDVTIRPDGDERSGDDATVGRLKAPDRSLKRWSKKRPSTRSIA